MGSDVKETILGLTPALAALAVLVAVPGCHTYAPVGAGDAAPGSSVRAHVRPDARPVGGDADDGTLDGTLVRTGGDTLLLAVWRADQTPGPGFDPQRDTLAIARTGIEQLEARRLSYLQTGLLAGGIGVGFYLVAQAFTSSSEGDRGSVGGPGDPTFIRVSVPAGIGPR